MTLEQRFQDNPADYHSLRVLKCKNHPVCRVILKIVAREPTNVADIEAACKADTSLAYCIEQSTVSMYLSQLRALGLVEFEPVGKMRYYRLPRKTVAPTPLPKKKERIKESFDHANYPHLVQAADSLMTHLR